ncbi:MAG: 2-oxo acid dehydrogenase subunit E2 [Dermatophilaceae bacterium]
MSERVKMPALGESVTEGTVTRWLKSVGDRIEVDEPLLEVSTDKVDTEIPSPMAGTLEEVLVHEDDTVPVGADLAVIGGGSGPVSDDAGPAEVAGSEDSPGTEPAAGPTQSAAGGRPAQDHGHRDQSDPTPTTASAEKAPAPASVDVPQPPPAASSGPATAGGAGTVVPMPALGESVTEGTVTRWLKQVGDEVAVDEPLLEVSTDKVDTEIPSPVAGTLTTILVGEDDTVPVGAELAIVGEPSGSTADAPATSAAPQHPAPPSSAGKSRRQGGSASRTSAGSPETAPPATEPAVPRSPVHAVAAPAASTRPPAPAPVRPADRPGGPNGAAIRLASGTAEDRDAVAYVTPLVRKLASDRGIDLGSVHGTGIGGRIRKHDVLAAATAAEAAEAERVEAAAAAREAERVEAAAAARATETTAPAARGSAPRSAGTAPTQNSTELAKRGTTETMTRLRRTIARRMVESLQVSAQLTTVVEVDVTRIARLRDRAKAEFAAREGTKLSFLPFFALAAVEALKTHPMVNASIDGDDVTYHGAEHLGVAVDTEKGLLVPVLKNAGDLNIGGLAKGIADVAERTRSGRIMPDDLAGGTFTVTNTGSRGALFDTPIINQPQVAILGTGSVVRRPVVAAVDDGGETIAIRSMVYLALSYDHRIVDGADAARFLTTIKSRLEEGAFEADLGL